MKSRRQCIFPFQYYLYSAVWSPPRSRVGYIAQINFWFEAQSSRVEGIRVWKSDTAKKSCVQSSPSEKSGKSHLGQSLTLTHANDSRRTLSKGARKNYTDAVLCLRKKPSLYKEVKGAKSRYDDFQALHIQQTFIIHFNVSCSLFTVSRDVFRRRLELGRLKKPQGSISRLASLVHVDI